jgi:hypothetical protein
MNMTQVYDWITKCVFMLDGTHKQYFYDTKLGIILEIYTHALTADGFDYWITTKEKPSRAYLNNNCKIAEDLVDKIYGSYVKDFLTYDAMLNDPMLYVGHLQNRIHILEHKLEEAERKLEEKENGLSIRLYRSALEDNDKLRYQLSQEKAAHTETKNRAIFASHILNGNRDEATKEFTNEYDKQIKNLISENGKLNREIADYKKSLNAWYTKFNKMV